MNRQPRPQPTAPAAFASVAEAEQAIGNLNAIMDRLTDAVGRETASARSGHLRNALGMDGDKAELARAYSTETARLQASKSFLAQHLPEALDRLRRRQETFRTQLQTNLTVLATAHAVAEGIIRGVSGELARKQAPSTYGASGRANVPNGKVSQPLALSRSL